jgi:hypothetical protein
MCGYVNHSGTLSLTNATVSGNSATTGGGLATFGGTTSLTNATVSGNSATTGGGLYNYGGTATLTNTIVAGRTNGGDILNNNGSVSGTYNLIGDGTGQAGLVNGINGNLVGTAGSPINPLLALLGDYGGPTQTMALLPGSPAIDAGTSTGAPTTDQRGVSRPQGSAPDIGAFESQGFTLTPVTGSTPQATVAGTAFAHPLAVTVKANNPGEPVNGGVITFAANPAVNGASATLSASSAVIAGGQASQASVTATANTVAGSYTVTASASGVATPAIFNLTNTPAAATHLRLIGPANVPNGSAFSLTVQALDAFNNIATGFRDTVKFTSTDTAAVLPDKYTFTASDNGVHTFTGLVLRKKGLQTITVFITAPPKDSPITGSININVV